MKKGLISILLLGFAGGALAQSLPVFEDVDANGDGAIDEQEAQAVEGLDFATADQNQDDELDRVEYTEATAEE